MYILLHVHVSAQLMHCIIMCNAQVGLKRDVTPQATEPPPTAHDEQAKAAEGEEPVAIRTTTNGDIETGR